MAWIYILQSRQNGRYYIGSTTDFDRRFSEHNRGQTKSTRGFGPWDCTFKQEIAFSDARRVERQLKRLKSRKVLERIIAEQSLDSVNK
jgi:putative endonuclease